MTVAIALAIALLGCCICWAAVAAGLLCRETANGDASRTSRAPQANGLMNH
jgi:hypothetical protein